MMTATRTAIVAAIAYHAALWPMHAGIVIGPQLGRSAQIRVNGCLGGDDAHGGPTTMALATVDDADPVMTLDGLTYTFTVTNTGANPIVNLSLAITIDTDSTFVGDSAGTFTSISGPSGGVVTATKASVAAGGTAVCTVTVTTPATAQTLSLSSSATADNATTANDTETSDVQIVAKDATSGIRCPISATQWTSLRACEGCLGTPYLLWLCQEDGSGGHTDLADSIGSLTGVKTGTTPTYGAAVSGWTRVFLSIASGSSTSMWNSSGSGGNLATTSHMTLAYVIGSGSGVAKTMIVIGSSGTVQYNMGHSGTLEQAKGVITDGVDTGVANGSNSINDAVHPLTFKYDRTNTVATFYTDKEAVNTSQYRALSGTTQVLLGNLSNNPAFKCGYFACFHGSDAELTNAQVKARDQALGFTVTGY